MPPQEATADLDGVLGSLGGFGRFQILNTALLSVVIAFSAVFGLNFIFTAGDLKYRCLVPGCDDVGHAEYDQPWLPYTVPMRVNNTYERCRMYTHANTSDWCDVDNFTTSTVSCRHWVFADRENTIVREDWGLQCEDNQWKLSLVGSVNNLGQVFGMPLAGFISDRYGRKTMIILGTIAGSIVGLIRSFSSGFYMFMTFEFLDRALSAGIFGGPFVLALELVSPAHRVLVGSIVSAAYPVGEVVLGLLAWWLQDWRKLLQICYAPAILVLSYYWLVPESVRWLMVKKRNEEAICVLRKVAKVNKIKVPDGMFDGLQPVQDEKPELEQKQPSLIASILKSKTMVLRFLNCAFCWMTNTFVFFGLSIVSVEVAGSKYMNFILAGVIELPAYFLTCVIMDKYGRRPSLIGSLLVSGLGCATFAIIPPGEEWNWARLSMFLVSKCAITTSFTVLYVYTTEMFPTSIRASSISVCSMVAKIGSTFAPQMPLLSVYLESLPLIIFGILCFISGGLSLAFPETLNVPLPDTVDEAEKMSFVRKKSPV